MNTPTITFSPKSMLLVMAYLCGSAAFVFMTLGAYEKQAVEQAKNAQEIVKW